MNNRHSERHVICCDRQKCFPGLWRDVEARHVTLDDVFIAQFDLPQFYEARDTIRRKVYSSLGGERI